MAKILIVDDSQNLRAELSNCLKDGGHEVVEAIDGIDGLAKAQASTGIQLIIADINMPRLDGLAMCQKLRALPGFQQVPFFVLTTEFSHSIKAEGQKIGVMAWIIKPFVAEKVLASVTKVLKTLQP